MSFSMRMGMGLGAATSVAMEQVDGYSYTNNEAAIYAAALTTAPDDTDAEALDTFVGALKTTGVFAKLDSLKLLCNWDETGTAGANATCMFNLIAPTKHKGSVATGTVTSTQYTGVSGAGSGALDDGFNPTTEGNLSSQDDVMFGVWVKTAANEAEKVQIGGSTGNNNFMLSRRWNSTPQYAIKINCTPYIDTLTLTTGLIAVIRTASNAWQVAYNATYAASSATRSSVTPVDTNIAVLANNYEESIARQTSDVLALSFVGKALSETEYGDFYSACNTFLTHLFGRSS